MIKYYYYYCHINLKGETMILGYLSKHFKMSLNIQHIFYCLVYLKQSLNIQAMVDINTTKKSIHIHFLIPKN